MGDNGFIYSHHTIINTAAKALSRLTTWSEEKPQAMICTVDFNRIVWNTFALLKPPLKTRRKSVY